ncbi:MAG: MBL fold metallo-hydrolase [Chloroflexi bacterium]|nr:MAG: MBL fold metallo-hydrolase [Chloroflexota bacterium]
MAGAGAAGSGHRAARGRERDQRQGDGRGQGPPTRVSPPPRRSTDDRAPSWLASRASVGWSVRPVSGPLLPGRPWAGRSWSRIWVASRRRIKAESGAMELLHRVVGPLATNVYVVADPASREAIAIDTAIPSLAFVTDALAERDWTLKLIVSSHGHWEVAEHTGAPIAAHPLDRHRLEQPSRGLAPFEIPPSVPAVDLVEGGAIRFGSLRLAVLHTPGHTEGSVCLLDPDGGLLFSGDTLFANGWGRVDLPGGSAEQMAASIAPDRSWSTAHGPAGPGRGARVRPGARSVGSNRGWSSWRGRAD